MYPEISQNLTCPPNALAWCEHHLGQKIVSVNQLKGSTSAILFDLETDAGEHVVLRLFHLKDWLEMEPDLALHEARVLQRLASSAVASPALIGFDETGAETTHPAVLMGKLDGRVELDPPDLENWLTQLAQTLCQIHQIPTEGFDWQYKHWFDPQKMIVPEWSHHPKAFEALIEQMRQPAPDMPNVFLHRDYHPTNVLWANGRISGVVDWVNGCVGPAMVDVAHCRLNLVSLYGLEAADYFLDQWLSFAGQDAYSRWWDICGLANGDVFGHELGVYGGWAAFGKNDVTVELLVERLDLFAKSLR